MTPSREAPPSLHRIRIYGPGDLETLDWPSSPEARVVRAFWTPLLREGLEPFIEGARAQVLLLQVDEIILPLMLPDELGPNPYVCSMRSHYVGASREEVKRLTPKGLRLPLQGLLGLLDAVLRRSRLDRAVFIDNWPISTVLHPRLSQSQIQALTIYLRAVYPDHALIFRSVQALDPLGEALRKSNYTLVPSRQVYLYSPSDPLREVGQRFRRDRALFRRSHHLVSHAEALGPLGFERLAGLYKSLFLGKYTSPSPRYTARFLSLAQASGFLQLRTVTGPEGIVGVLGFWAGMAAMTSPLFGYDTSLPAKRGIYRLLYMIQIQEAETRGILLNASAGAGPFKRSRGAQPSLEYHAVFLAGLPLSRRAGWTLLRLLLEWIAVPLVRWRGL
jgi:hypothetical protein